MAATKGQIILQCVILCFTFYMVSPLTLPYMTTRKPRITKYTTSTIPPGAVVLAGTPAPAATAPVTPTNRPLYKVTGSNGATCILMRTDALIEINFKSHVGDEKGDAYLPDDPSVSGTCDDYAATMSMVWPGYILDWKFAKTPGGERWYVDELELTVSTEIHYYHNIRVHGKTFKLAHTNMLFPTPVGKSYSCDDVTVLLFPTTEDAPEGLKGQLLLRALQLQPFLFKTGGAKFGASFQCNLSATMRDETAPIAVGSTLAVAVLLTVTGYGIFRYLKVKKVQYNTME